MKALSLRQPWASLLAGGAKRVETRSWRMHHRGWLLVHAAAKFVEEAELCHVEPYRAALIRVGGIRVTTIKNPGPDLVGPMAGTVEEMASTEYRLPLGAIIGRVFVVGCWATERVEVNLKELSPPEGRETASLHIDPVERAFGNYDPGRFATLTERAELFKKPVKYRGCLGLFDVDDAFVAEHFPDLDKS